ncbi:MAG: hypothetical protein J6T10_27850 [Methanobrevibacter sp.]|nr:hypothetical protein [Methanobrevibacter sp.]
MELNELRNIVKKTQRGSIHTITYAKELKTRKGVDDTVIKITTLQGRFGVEYDNIKSVQEARENGTAPATNGGLVGAMVWDDHRYILKNENTGKYQLRVTKCNRWPSKVIYMKNGVVVDKEEIKPLCLKSEFPDYAVTKPAPIFNIGVEKIVKIK